MNGDDLWFEQPGDELGDDEFPEHGEFDGGEFDGGEFDDDSTETVPCSQCGIEVYEDAVQCPNCGSYIDTHTNVWAGRPAWWVALALLGVAAVILVLVGYSAW